MGHNMYVWPLQPFQPGTPLPPKDTAVAQLRLNAAEGRHSPLYTLFDADSCNNLDSGDGTVLLIRQKEFDQIKENAWVYRLSKEEQAFIDTIDKTAPHGFAILFE